MTSVAASGTAEGVQAQLILPHRVFVAGHPVVIAG